MTDAGGGGGFILLSNERKIFSFGSVPILPVFSPSTQEGETAVYKATWGRNIECVELLVRAGANLNVEEEQSGQIPLHMTAHQDDEEIFKLPLPGSDLTIVDYYDHVF